MKFFKHFTDAHRGKSILQIEREFGLEGIARYWILVEICAEKMVKEEHEKFTEEHCVFELDWAHVRRSLRFRSALDARCFVVRLALYQLYEFDDSPTICRIKMPKLLEWLDRDTKRARTDRGQPAPKKKKKNKEEEEEVPRENSAPPRLVEIWNEHRGVLARIRGVNAARLKKVTLRWPECSEPEWIETVQRIAKSDFCIGKNDRGWKADFDWLLQPGTRLKVLEGKYDNKTSNVREFGRLVESWG